MNDDDTHNAASEPPPGSGGRRARFIAGAVCPECGVMDRIVVEEDSAAAGGGAMRRCVACGFADSLTPGSGSMPPTRFSRAPGIAKPDSSTSTVRLVPRKDPRS